LRLDASVHQHLMELLSQPLRAHVTCIPAARGEDVSLWARLLRVRPQRS
jgi:hypothetical protein